eukprot:g15166.t1
MQPSASTSSATIGKQHPGGQHFLAKNKSWIFPTVAAAAGSALLYRLAQAAYERRRKFHQQTARGSKATKTARKQRRRILILYGSGGGVSERLAASVALRLTASTEIQPGQQEEEQPKIRLHDAGANREKFQSILAEVKRGNVDDEEVLEDESRHMIDDIVTARLDALDLEDIAAPHGPFTELYLFLATYDDGPPEPAMFFCDQIAEAANDFRFGKGTLAAALHGGADGKTSSSPCGCRSSSEGKNTADSTPTTCATKTNRSSDDASTRTHDTDEDDRTRLSDVEDLEQGSEGADDDDADGSSSIFSTDEEDDGDFLNTTRKPANDSSAVDLEELDGDLCGPSTTTVLVKKNGGKGSTSSLATQTVSKKMLSRRQKENLAKEGYQVVGQHSAVKLCRWTKHHLRGRGGCYKHTFYGIASLSCMEATPSLACANKCVFCWRHHKNPVAKEWEWVMDEPNFIVQNWLSEHAKMIKTLKGVPGVTPERFEQAKQIKHCALSLVGEPIMYPKINELLGLLHAEGISTFLVTNAQFPEQMKALGPVTQMYLSIDAATKETLKAVDRPLKANYWDCFLESIDALRDFKFSRTVFRLTLVQGKNMDPTDIAEYAKLIGRGEPDFIEIKGVTYNGDAQGKEKMTMKSVPWHHEVVAFGRSILAAAEAGLGERYELACEHEHSLIILLARKEFKVVEEVVDAVSGLKTGEVKSSWCTHIDYDEFQRLVRTGEWETKTSLDYSLPTPHWAVSGAPEKGFDPADTRLKTAVNPDTRIGSDRLLVSRLRFLHIRKMGDPYALPVKQPKAPKNSKKNLARQAPEDPGDPLRTPPKDEGRNAAADDLEQVQERGSRRSGVKINYSNAAEDGAARNAEADVDIRNTKTNGRGRDVVGVPPRGRGAAPKRPPREAERANAAYKLDSVRPSITGSDPRSAGVVTGTYTLEGRWKAAAASREAALEQTRAADRDRNASKATVASAIYPDEVRLAEGVGISDGDFVEVADCFVAVARCEPGLKPSNPLKVYLSKEIARNLAHAAGTLMSQVSETESGAGVQDSCEIADGSESNEAARERETLLTALWKIGDSYEQDNCGADEKVQQVANERPQIATNCNNKQAKAASSRNPEKYARFGVSAPKGLLLYGPPGTGKTLLAKALSEELQCHCEMLEAADVCAHPEPEAKIVEVFEKCREVALLGLPPVDAEAKSLGKTSSSRKKGCLLFIDEIDALCPKREEALSESDRRVVATFLTLLDGVGAKHSWGDATSSGAGGGSPRSAEGRGGGLVLLAATNRPNALDPALRRPGRLDREIEVGAPNKQGRLQILEIMLLRMSLRSRISDEELLKVAEDTNGFVGADLQGLCNQVAMLLMEDDKNSSCSSIASSFKAALQTVRPSALKELQIEIPSVYWRDIGGYSHLKEQLQQSVEWPFKYAELFAQMKLRAPKGILLYGPPGCSKTMMAKAVATESKMNFIGIKGPELFNKYVGESERKLRDVFRKARQAQPCVIFFDEIDSMAGDRGGGSGGGGGDSVSGRVLSQLLNEMDGVGKQQELVILAATNRPEALDPAILRPGRFDRLLYVRLPDLEARKEIFRRSLGKGTLLAEVESSGKKKQIQRQSAQNYIDETILELAERTEQFSGAEVVNLVKEASLTAVREAILKGLPKPGLTRKMLLGAVDKAKPRTSRAAIDFYENFEHKMA